VRAQCWCAATARHFPEVAEAMLAAARASGGGAALLGRPSAAEWQAAYKLLTLVPWTTLRRFKGTVNKLAPMRVCVHAGASPSMPTI
jgi:hypothetical protein